MKLKKILSVVLCAALALSLAGCGNGSGDKEKSKNALERVQDAGVLKVAVSPDFAPYEFMDPSKSGQDTYVGADIEMIKYIAEKLGVEIEILAMDFDTCLAGVTQNKADCSVNGYYPSEERKKSVDFTDAYFDDSEQVVVINKEDAGKYKEASDFDGETVTAQNASAQDSIVDEYLSGAKKQLINKVTDGIQMVKSKKAVGVVLQKVVADSIVASDDTLAIAEPVFIYDEAELVVAVNKDSKELKDKMNEIIKEINDKKLYEGWLVEAQELTASIGD
ncbi:MAG: transporter substrate-binding domain-containing protein [Lachnospiraceae bacterium]|nr:transporter substrate-binding domain-containing protein [Lachnospiraceae bacterium]MDE7053030.1 transporter substrate-binding domain-containing protein [Lachnospiraceae bacterium]